MSPKIIFSRHAIYQIKERNIDEEQIFLAVFKPDKLIYCPDGKIQFLKRIRRSGKTYLLIVVCKKINSSIKIITAFITSKINKYLK